VKPARGPHTVHRRQSRPTAAQLRAPRALGDDTPPQTPQCCAQRRSPLADTYSSASGFALLVRGTWFSRTPLLKLGATRAPRVPPAVPFIVDCSGNSWRRSISTAQRQVETLQPPPRLRPHAHLEQTDRKRAGHEASTDRQPR